MRRNRTFQPKALVTTAAHGIGFRPTLEHLEDRAVPSTLYVDDDKAQRPTAQYTTIQAAVNAAGKNDTIIVEPGTYTEQVSIVGPAKSGLTVEADPRAPRSAGPATIVAPAVLVPNASANAIVTIDGAKNVTLDGFTITGPNAALDYGVQVLGGASVTISDNTVTAIRSAPLSGVQTGTAIEFGGTGSNGKYGGTGTVTGNTITDYQKGGVEVDGDTSVVCITSNVITGAGPTAVIAQNGVQVAYGASARVSGNTITNNVYTPAGTEATGVYVYQGGTVCIAGNQLAGNEDGVLVEMTTCPVTISGNSITGAYGAVKRSDTLYGIGATDSKNITVLGNAISNVGGESYGSVVGAGIALDGTSNSVVALNLVTGSGGYGISVTDGSSNNVVVLNVISGSKKSDVYYDGTGTGNFIAFNF